MLNKKVAFGVAILALFVSLYGSYAYFGNDIVISPKQVSTGSSVADQNTEEVSTEPKTEECPINGKMYPKTSKEKWEKRRPLGIMVENHTDSRPQSGISSADVVYEAVAEGGITRFLAIFYCQDAKFVGPVRSARVYFIKLLEGYGNYPLYAHVGGANTEGPADALGYIETLKWAQYNDLNQFSVPFPNFWRDYDRLPDRATEHTVYTSTDKLWKYAKDKRELANVDEEGIVWDKEFTPWKFQDDAKTEERGEDGSKISFGFWTQFASDYAVTWTYNKKTNGYKRENGGSAHTDKNNGKQIEAKDVVVIFANESSANDGYEGGHILYKVVGSGEALVFQNGNAISATWQKTDKTSNIVFTDEDDKDISLVRGQVFVEVLPTGNKVTY